MFNIFKSETNVGEHLNLDAAILKMESLFNKDDFFDTFTVQDEEGRVLASCSKYGIWGDFKKQKKELGWGSRTIETEDFDATNSILLMEHADLIELEDDSEQTDNLGRSYIEWHGPCAVAITKSICRFFGVKDMEYITPENFTYVKNKINPQPLQEKTIELTVKIKINSAPNADIDDFISNLDYSFTSNTKGIVVCDTEITDTNNQ
jgi:hypothetical protein